MSKTAEPDLRYVANHLPKTADPYLALLSKAEVTRARDFHRSFPQYAVTPLADLRHMAEYLGVARVAVKDESWRFGLNSFKVLGGSYAIGRFLAQEMGRDISELPYSVLVSDGFIRELGFGEIAVADQVGDEHGINVIRLALADLNSLAPAVGLDGVDDMDGVALVEQEGIQRQPIVAGGLHADRHFASVMGNFGNPGSQALRAFCGVGEGKTFEQRFLDALAQHGRHMMLLADIDSKVEHLDHRYLLDFG